MGNYFYGWRRMTGVVMLEIACLFTAGREVSSRLTPLFCIVAPVTVGLLLILERFAG